MNKTLDEKILEQIRPIIADQLGIDPNKVTMETRFTYDLGADSLDAVDFRTKFQVMYGTNIPEDKLDTTTSVGDVVNVIKEINGLHDNKRSTKSKNTKEYKMTDTDKEIFAKIRPIIAKKLELGLGAVTPKASFTKDLGADSIDKVELMMEIERDLHVIIPDSDQENIKTVGDVINVIKRYPPKTMPTKSNMVLLLAMAKRGKQR